MNEKPGFRRPKSAALCKNNEIIFAQEKIFEYFAPNKRLTCYFY